MADVRGGDGGGGEQESKEWYAKFTKPNGRLVKNESGEDVFMPSYLIPNIAIDSIMARLMSQAERKIGELKGLGASLQNPRVMIRAYLKREAVFSSRIEGTTATLDDLNMHEVLGGVIESSSDATRLQEVINYVDALDEALTNMNDVHREIDLEVILRAHRTLMQGVRGEDKAPGRLRKKQNYIVTYANQSARVRYKPPPYGEIPSLLEDMIEFLRNTSDKDVSGLIQSALIHYQFEAIHPFLDGNGRVGRLLIPLILNSKGVLPEPLLYISAYFEENRDEYYRRLRRVSQTSEWQQWVVYFLTAVIEQADRSIETIQNMTELEKKYRGVLDAKNVGPYAKLLLPSLFANPYITIPLASKNLNKTYPAAKKAVNELVAAGILRRAKVNYRARVFYAEEIDSVLGKC